MRISFVSPSHIAGFRPRDPRTDRPPRCTLPRAIVAPAALALDVTEVSTSVMRAGGQTFQDIVTVLDSNNNNIGAGYIEKRDEQFLIRAPGQVKSLDDMRNVILNTVQGVPVRIRDVAEVEVGRELRTGAAPLLLNLGFAWLVGSWFARYWIRSSGVDHDHFEPALRKLDLMAAAISMVGSASALLSATAVMGGVGQREACPMFWMMVSTTDYGHAGCAIVVAMLVLFFVRLVGGVGRSSDIAVVLLLAIFSATRASMGHAGEEGFWTIPLAVEAIHFFAIGLWTGAVMVSGWFVLHESRIRKFDTGSTDQYLELMSQAAMLAVVAIVATGIYSTWHRVGSSEHLIHTNYGITLLVKVALVLVAIALGGYNKFHGLPAASRSSRGVTLVRVVLQVETLLLLGALFAAAILTTQQPPTAM